MATKNPAPDAKPKVLLLCLAGADWRLVHPLLDAGELPFLSSIVERGTSGSLLSQPPAGALSEAACLATGCRSDKHGILGWLTVDDDAGPVRPFDAGDLLVPPLWDIIATTGDTAVSVGWPVTHPATRAGAMAVSDAFALPLGEDFERWSLLEDSVPGDDSTFDDLRLHPRDLGPEELLPFMPNAARIDQETDERLGMVATALAKTLTNHAAATWLIEQKPWRFAAVYLDLIEQLSASFLQYRAPRMAHVTEIDHDIYGEVVDGTYRYVDLLVGRYLALAGPDTYVLVVSDHGYLTDDARPKSGGLGPTRSLEAQRPLGLFACCGPDVRTDDLVVGATLLDVAPTILHLLGLPTGMHMDGKVLSQIFANPIEPLQSEMAWRIPDATDMSRGLDLADWQKYQIADWCRRGYLMPLATNPEAAVEQVTIERSINLAQVHRYCNEYAEALEVLADVIQIAPDHLGARISIAQCWLALEDPEHAREALEDLGQTGREGALIDLLWSQLSLLEGDTKAADEHLERARSGKLTGHLLHEQIGRSQLDAGQWKAAATSFREALTLDPDFAAAHSGLGLALYSLDDTEAALEHLTLSLGLLYQQPNTHFNLGLVLARNGHLTQASSALRNALELAPDHSKAARLLGRVERALIENITREVSLE